MNRPLTLHIAYLAITALLVTLFGGCRQAPLSPRLTDINTLSETAPLATLDSLHSINPDTLSDRDRNYYDFLTVKCERKAYLPIESDSLILKVIDYASRHQADGYYPEALYTGGLVYTALGDQPTALEYFHKGLAALPKEDTNLLLREKLNSQTGKLFSNLRLDGEGIPFIKTAIELARQRKDTLALVSEYQLLAGNYRRAGNLMEADSIISLCLSISRGLDSHTCAVSIMQHAMLQHSLGNSDSARYYIRQAVDCVPEYINNTALTYAGQIYHKAGMIDSACYFAYRLINSDRADGKVCGYQILLSPESRRIVTSPTGLDSLYSAYATCLTRYMDENSMEMVREQEASYNYSLHQKKRMEAENQSYRRGMWIAILIACCAVLVLGITIVRSRSQRKVLQLRNAITELQRLKTITEQDPEAVNSEILESETPDNKKLSETEKLRIELRKQLMDLLRKNPNPEVPEHILASSVYKEFLQLAEEGRAIADNSEKWIQLERVIDKVSPDFVQRLKILSAKKLKSHEVHLAMLIKCGFRVTDAANLIALSKQTISYHRRKMSTLFANHAVNNGMMDALIRLM